MRGAKFSRVGEIYILGALMARARARAPLRRPRRCAATGARGSGGQRRRRVPPGCGLEAQRRALG
eukprot:6483051-Alexandrium_andersonii.AAC.1